MTHNHRHFQFEPQSSAHASSLPSRYKSKFMMNAGCYSAHTLTGQSVGGTDGHSLEQVAGAQQNGQVGPAPDITAREQALDDLVYRTHQTKLR